MRPQYNILNQTPEKQMLEKLKKAHLNLTALDSGIFPDDLCEARRNFEQLMLKYIWRWSNELSEQSQKG